MIGYIYSLLSAFLYASLSIVAKFVYAYGFSPLEMLLMMATTAAVIMWVSMLIFRRKNLLPSKQAFKRLLIQGTLGSTGTSVFYFLGLKHLDASIAILILFTHPAIVMIFDAIFYKVHFGKRHFLALVFTSVGCTLVLDIFAVKAMDLNMTGVLLCGTASLCLAFGNFYGQKTIALSDPTIVLVYTTTIEVFEFLLFEPTFLFTDERVLPSLPAFLVVTFFTWLLPYLFILRAIKHIGASRASMVSTSEVIFTLLLAFAFLGETMQPMQVAGGIMIFSAMFILPHHSETAPSYLD